jgi:uncharacterized membrane protein YwaF
VFRKISSYFENDFYMLVLLTQLAPEVCLLGCGVKMLRELLPCHLCKFHI